MQDDHEKHSRILSAREVFGRTGRTGISKSTGYELMRTGGFPPPVQITAGRVGWPESQVEAWINSRPTVDLRKPIKDTSDQRGIAA